MSKIPAQLTKLDELKRMMVDYLRIKGVVADYNETYNTLVPKILEILQVQGDLTLGTKTITKDGDYFPVNDGVDAYSSIKVNIMNDNNALIKYDYLSGSTRYLKITNYGDLPDYAWNTNSKVEEIVLKDCSNIGKYAFNACDSVNSCTNDSVIKSIGEYAFNNCSGMVANLVLDDTIEIIPRNCFYNCQDVQLNLPNNLKEVQDYAFYSCTNLNVNALPEGLEKVGVQSFRGCTNLRIDKLPSSLKTIGSSAFQICTNVVLKELPPISIPTYAFTNSGVQFNEIPNGCSLGAYAFGYCNRLTNLIFNHTGIIPNYCFQYCSNLEAIEIGTGVTTINTYAFRNCSKLKTITCHRTTPPSLFYSSFYNCPIEKIYVPASVLDTYKSATNWSAFADKMIGIEGE